MDIEDTKEVDDLFMSQLGRSTVNKVYEHVPPRIDADRFQADIPNLILGTTKNNKPTPTSSKF